MPTLRHKAEFYSDQGVDWEIYIDDADYASTENTFKVADGTGFRLKHEGQNGSRIEPLMPSSVTFTMSVANSTDEQLITDFVGAEEGRFKVKILKGGNLYWVGFILTDTVQIQDLAYPYDFQITATDGLARLKKIDYNNSGTAYSGRETFLEHIYNCFDKMPFGYFHGASDSFLEVVQNWYEDNHVVVAGLDALTVSDFDHRVFVKIDDKNRVRYTSCYDVLKNIATLFRARIKQADGNWRFEQPTQRTGSFTEWKYSKTASQLSYSTTSYDYTINQTSNQARLGGGVYSYFPPLDKVCLTYKHLDDENLLGNTEFSSDVVATTQNLGEVDIELNNSKFRFSGLLQYAATWLDFNESEEFRLVYKFQIKCGDKYLKRETEVIGGTLISYGPVSWTTNATHYEVSTHFYHITNQTNPTINDSLDLSFTTPTIPGPLVDNPRDVTFKFEWVEARDFTNNVILPGSIYSTTYILDNPVFQFLGDGDKVKTSSSTIYCITNDYATTNTETINLDVVMADGPLNSSYSKIKVYDGSGWVVSGEWRVNDTGTAYKIQELAIRDTLGGQSAPVKKYQGTMFGNIRAHDKLIIGTDEYIYLGGSFNANMDETTGTWYVIAIDYTNLTIEDVEQGNEGPIIHDDGGEGQGNGEGGIISNGGGVVGITGTQVQTGFDLDAPVGPGYTETVGIADTSGNALQEGDLVTLINPYTGLSQDVTVQQDMQAGDDFISIFTTLDYNFPAGSYVIPTGSQTVQEDQITNEIVTNFFEPGATIEDIDYYLETTAKVPVVHEKELVAQASAWTVHTPAFYYAVPPLYNGAILTNFVAAKTAGSGSGNNTIDIKVNGSTVETLNLAATVKTATGTVETTLSTGDEITTDITAITASTAAAGCNYYIVLKPALEIETQKIKYTLNRVITDGLRLWYKMNRSAMIPIGTGSVLFDGTQRIDCGDDPTLDITGNFTVMGWAKFGDIGGSNETIIGKYDSSSDGFVLLSDGTNIKLQIDTANSCAFAATGSVLNGKWYHIAATWDGSTAKIYLDGYLKDADGTYANPTTSTQELQIGTYNDTAGEMEGNLTKVAIWGEALTNDQINSVMNKTYSKLTDSEKTDLISWWALNSVSDLTDSHGSNDGTIGTT